MAATISDLRARVAVEGAEKAKSDLSGVGKGVHGLSEDFKKGLGAVTGFLAGFGAISLVSDAINLVRNNFGDWMKGALDAQAISNETNRILNSQSHVLGITGDQVDKLATKYMNLTGVDDDVIHQAENIILGYHNISQKAFPDVLKASLDLTKQMQLQGQTSANVTDTAKNLGLALEDPTKASRLLRQYGISLTEAQQEQIKTFMKHGDVAKADALILDLVKGKAKDAAEQFGQTNEGKIARFHATLDNMGKSLAGALLPTLGDLFNAALPLVQQFGEWLPGALKSAQEWFGKLWKDIGPFAGAVKDFVVNAWSKLQAALQDPAQQKQFANFGVILHNLGDAFQKAWPGIKQFAETTGKNLVDAFQKAWPKIQEARQAFADFTATVIEKVEPIVKEWWPKIQAGLEALQQAWNAAWPSMQEALSASWGVIQGIVEIGWNIISGIIKVGMDILGGNWKGAWKDIQDSLSGVWHGIQQIGQTLFGKFRDWLVNKAIEIKDNIVAKFGELKDNALSKLGELKDNALKTIGELPGKLKDLGGQMIQKLIEGIQNLAGNLKNTVGNVIHNAFANLPGGIHIPGFASGGVMPLGGLALVGERGPELVTLPMGSHVYPAQQTQQMLSGGGNGVTHQYTFAPGSIVIHAESKSGAQLLDELQREIQWRKRGNG